eukprot:CAMPEP_0171333968 /NCGR_PEP_ID=MMETSP0878-20121228/4351_1 /TAXON_ID=67004 /ORGANISM="Thalassiosira weissflogii, Strain CCMP1336" /LENGTH=437 /DNA_ID=CAMNT_0011834987 /DNA_START=154 /DNA_END=1464 /DNA_ORIENTATION=-
MSPRRDISLLLREHSCRSRRIRRNPCFVSSEFSACFHTRNVPLQRRKFAAMLKYSSHSASFVEADEKALIAPFFPIYYNDVYEVNLPPGHRFPIGKYREVRISLQSKIEALSQDEQSRVDCDFRISPLATVEQLITTHDEHYVQRYLNGKMTELENRNIGFPWSLQHVNRTLSSVGGTVAAALSAWEKYCKRHELIQKKKHNRQGSFEDTTHLCWSAHVAGGTHHAFKDYGEGFCIFSDIAVAANVLLQKYPAPALIQQSNNHTQKNQLSTPAIRRILIIDLDVHQGNGNAVLFQEEERVKTFSMQCKANYFSKKEQSDLDIELPVGCRDETYLSTLRFWLKNIENYPFDEDGRSDEVKSNTQKKPFDIIFFQAGVDIHKDDRLGRLSISTGGISRRNQIVFEFVHRMKSPLVICMGGGYPRDEWDPILKAHTNVYW